MPDDGTLSLEAPNGHFEHVGPYRLAGELGRGGMGVVYRAQDERSGAMVALKVLPPHLREDAVARAQLLKEARAVATLDHPNVCALVEAGETDGDAIYLAMPLYDGETLEALLARGPLSVGEAVELGRQLARGLTAAHAAGVVHRDIKPSNILLGTDGVARLMDFGVARLDGATRTRSGGGSGTLPYSAPEQIQGEAEVASDLWAVGVVLYEALAGRRPFRGRYEAALLYAILHGAPESLRTLRPEVPAAVEAVVFRCLEKRPEDRLADAEALERALAAALEGERPPSSRRVRRHLGLSGSLLSVATLVGVLAWPSLQEVLYPLPVQRHVAVLPFSMPTPDPPNRAFADGLTEAVSGALTQFEQAGTDLWIIPFEAVRSRNIQRAADAWRSLHATLVVMGRVANTEDGLRLSLSLVDARNGRQLRTATVTAGSEEADAMAGRATHAIARMLDAVAPRGVASTMPPTTVPAAFRAYLLAQGYLALDLGTGEPTVAELSASHELLTEAIRADPQFALAIAQLARVSRRLEQQTGDPRWGAPADSLYRRAVSLAPGSPPVLTHYSYLLTEHGQHEEAVRTLREAIAIDPNYLEAYERLGVILMDLGRLNEVEVVFRSAIHQRPNDARPRQWLGSYLLAFTQRYEEARDVLLEGIRLDPENHDIYTVLGHLADKVGEDPTPYYRKSVSLRPSALVYALLGRNALADGDLQGSLQYYRLRLRLDSSDASRWKDVALAHWRIPVERPQSVRHFEACVLRYERRLATERSGQDLRMPIFLAQCYAGLGRQGRAREILTELQPAAILRGQSSASTDERARYEESRSFLYEFARAYVLMGDTLDALAVDLLHDAYLHSERMNGWLARRITSYPEYRPLMRHPRWAELERARVRQ